MANVLPPHEALSARRRRLVEALSTLESWGAAREWTGTDAYDGLNATRLVSPLLRHPRGRQAVTQLVKRSPFDLRPLLGIRPAQSSAALAQVISSYARNRLLSEHDASFKLRNAVAALESLRCTGFEEPCWGYHFDVQTRVFFYPKGAPNTIATSFGGLAMLDAYEATGESRLLDLALGTGRFFLRHVPQTGDGDGDGAYFGYLVGDRTPIHNANLLVCALLARLAEYDRGEDLLEAARAGVAYTESHQRQDGSWPYGELPHLAWVDGFHTGYVLECLMVCAGAGACGASGSAALERGLDYYRRELFLPDGTPKYLPSALYPVDSQCVAQGIQTFARAAAIQAGLQEMAWRIFDYSIAKMRRRDGAFIFQRRRLWRNRIPHIRWSATPMMLAFTHLLRASDAESLGS